MKIAIVHDWLTVYAGAERVLEQILQLYPDADLFSLVDFLPRGEREFIHNKPVHTSFLQKLPFARTHYRRYLCLMPLAIEQFDLSGYDLVISSSYAVAKGVITGPDQLHISYVHSPMRYAWDLQHQYLRETRLDKGISGWLAKWVLHKMRLWDAHTANGVDYFIANSHFIARRIWKVYRREASIIYPPVDTTSFALHEQKEDLYLTASRLVPYKKIDLIVEAFNGIPNKRLVVIGDGPDFKKIQMKAGQNISLLGYQGQDHLKKFMQRAKAFVFAAEEDFGISPLEAQACGTPVIAYAKGGVLETIRGLNDEHPTGVFFKEQNAAAIVNAIEEFEQAHDRIPAERCRENAMRFGQERFRQELKAFMDQAWEEFQNSKLKKHTTL